MSQGLSARRRIAGVIPGLVRGLLMVGVAAAMPASANQDLSLVERGEYLLHAGGCISCHTDTDNAGALLAGGRALATPFGTFYTPNITPHREYGIGGWSDADFLRAMKLGLAPDGRNYYPAFPYTAYAGMRREDVLALKAYLETVSPVASRNRSHDLPWYLRSRSGVWLWKWLYFESRGPAQAFHGDTEKQRGAYLVEALAHCGECHTPRGVLGGLQSHRRHAGTRDGPDGDSVPNITPDRGTGIGKWSHDDVVYYLQTGATPGGDYAGGLMAEVIDHGTSHLTDQDLRAIAGYVLSLPAIENDVTSKKKTKRQPGEFE